MEEQDLLKLSKKLRKNYSSIRLASEVKDNLEYISTGNLAIDLMLEGGIAWGYVSEFAGLSQSGKTLLLQMMLADAQKRYGATGIWLDRENAWRNDRAEQLGIDLSKVIVVSPVDIPTVPAMQTVFKEVLKMVDPEEYRFISIDSISSFDYDGASDMGRKAKALHEFFRSILPEINSKTSLNFANQITFKIGVMFGDPSTTVGGEGPKYYSHYRLKLDNKKQIRDPKKGNEVMGNWIEAYITKTRTGPSHRSVNFPFYYKEGIPYYGGYGRLLAKRGYLKPKNVAEFKSFKQSTLLYEPDADTKLQINEHEIEAFLEKYPHLKFDIYPEYNDGNISEEVDEEEDE